MVICTLKLLSVILEDKLEQEDPEINKTNESGIAIMFWKGYRLDLWQWQKVIKIVNGGIIERGDSRFLA